MMCLQGDVKVKMEISVAFLLIGCLTQGVLCHWNISMPWKVEALQGSCVFIPCTFDIDPRYNYNLTNNTKRLWIKERYHSVVVFDSSSPSSGQLKGEILGSPTEKNCTTQFDNVSLEDNGSYRFTINGSGGLLYEYHNLIYIDIIESPPEPTVNLLQYELGMMEGNSVTLHCSIKIFCVSRPPSLTWSSTPEHFITDWQYQNQTYLISNLYLTLTHHHHNADFTCTATYQLQQEITTNTTYQLSVQYSPKSTSANVNPAGVAVEGHSVTLSCSSDGNPAVNYTWYRQTEGDLNLTGSNWTISNTNLTNPNQTVSNTNLTISRANPSHSGLYYCKAENRHGTENTSVILDVQYAPKSISAHVNPAGVIIEGHSVTLSCSSDGNPAVKYTWYRHIEGDLKPMQTRQRLTISNISPSHSGRYDCKAENQHGIQKTSVLMDVQYAPKNIFAHVNPAGAVKEGRSVILSCSSDGNPAVNYTWYRQTEGDLKPVQTGSNWIISNTNLTDPNQTVSNTNLTISRANPSHSGLYYCIAENCHGTENTSVILDIQYAPKSISAHVNPAGVIMEGHYVTLSCSSDGNPAVKYTWYRHIEGDLKPMQTEQRLTISNINPSHSGRYDCTAENQHGIQKTSVLMDVQYAPKNIFAHINPAGAVMEGRSVILSCSSDANPAVKFTWYKVTEGVLTTIQTGPLLTISNTNPSHNGQYYCTAQNQHGIQRASVLLDVQCISEQTQFCIRPANN